LIQPLLASIFIGMKMKVSYAPDNTRKH